MISFEDTQIAFQDKNNRELQRAYLLFRMIGSPALVKAGASLLRAAMAVRFPVKWALKPTVFSHFCGGETINECDETIYRLGRSKIKTILDYSAEGKETEADFDYTRDQILATIAKARNNPFIPHAVFKPTGVARFALLEKVQAGKTLSASEQKEFERVKDRIDKICEAGVSVGIPVMIDAEESWIQGIVDEIVEEMILKYNTEKPLIYHTLQMYRHDRMEYLERFTRKARDMGRFPAFKLVRGAYMEKERERARKMGYPSPICPDKPATDRNFDDATEFCLDDVDHIGLCIGTHNENSCAYGVEIMEKRKIAPGHLNVWYSQLLGMSDHISYNLAARGYNVSKYVPYGPVKTVVPYLIRRAEENTSVAGQTSRELYLLKKEVARRKAES
jgi:proline dehydrogenase